MTGPALDPLRPGNLKPIVDRTGRPLETCEQLGGQLRPPLVSQRQGLASDILSPHCHGTEATPTNDHGRRHPSAPQASRLPADWSA
jgi:hypothetical protein